MAALNVYRAIGVGATSTALPIAALPKRPFGVGWEAEVLAHADSWPLRVVELAEAIARERAALLDRIARIDVRLPEIEARLSALAGKQSAEGDELEAERGELISRRREADSIVKMLDSSTTATDADRRADERQRRERQVIGRCNAESADIARQVVRFEAQGDFRQARLWRLEGVSIRERVEKEVR